MRFRQQLTEHSQVAEVNCEGRVVRAVGAGGRSSRTRFLPEARDGAVQVGRERAAIG